MRREAKIPLAVFYTSMVLSIAACSSPREANKGVENESAKVHFEEGKGLLIPEETRSYLQVSVTQAAQKNLRPSINIAAQIFALQAESNALETGSTLASGSLLPIDADSVGPGAQFTGTKGEHGIVLKLDKTTTGIMGRVDTILRIIAPRKFTIGEPVTGRIIAAKTINSVTIPESALLSTAEGTFVYAFTEGFFKREPVLVLEKSDGIVALAGGLAAGQQIVTNPVEKLWLIELKETVGTAGGG